MGDAPVYITFDIDGVDPGYAPGTGQCLFIKLCMNDRGLYRFQI